MSKDLELVMNAAREAGKIVKKGYGNIKEISDKGEGKGIVTDVDKKSEEIIKNILNSSGYSFLGEEEGRTDNNSEYCWVIDPIDGTTNFSRGIPLFAISIALIKNDELLIGVILNPITDECFYAEKGKGAFLNGKKISVSDKNILKGNEVLLEGGYSDRDKDIYATVTKIFSKESYTRRFGTTALEICYVANGSAEAFLSSGDSLWDFAAGLILVKEAGGKVTDWKGKDWSNKSSFICATNGLVHNEVIEQIKDLQ